MNMPSGEMPVPDPSAAPSPVSGGDALTSALDALDSAVAAVRAAASSSKPPEMPSESMATPEGSLGGGSKLEAFLGKRGA